MIGLLASIPFMIIILTFLFKAASIIIGGRVKKINKSSRQFRLFIAGLFICGTLPYILGIISGIYFDLMPDDPFVPAALDRFTFLGAFLGICLIAPIALLIFIRFSVLYNISKDLAKKISLALILLIVLSGCPMIVEAGLFASKSIDHANYLVTVRYLFLGGSVTLFLFMAWEFVVLSQSILKLSRAKKIRQDMMVIKTIYICLFSTLASILLFFAFYILLQVVEYRSKEYIWSRNIAGFFIGFCALSAIELQMNLELIVIDVLEHSNKATRKVCVPAAKKDTVLKITDNQDNITTITKITATILIIRPEMDTIICK